MFKRRAALRGLGSFLRREPRGEQRPMILEALESRAYMSADLVGAFGTLNLAAALATGTTGTADVVVRNTGDKNATGATVRIDLYASRDQAVGGDILLGTTTRTSLNINKGKSATIAANVTVPNTLEPGTYYLVGRISSPNVVENSTANNDVTATTLAAPVTRVFVGNYLTSVSQPGEGGWTVGTTLNNGLVDFVAGPAGAPLGSGSLRLSTPASADKATLQRFGSYGPIGNFTASYQWYRTGGSGTVAAPALKLIIDTPDANPSWANYDKALIFEPYQDGAVATSDNTWTTENITSTQGGWWLIDYSTTPSTKLMSPIRSISQWLANPTYGASLAASTIISLELGAGSGNAGLDGYVDNLQYSYRLPTGQQASATVNFEPTVYLPSALVNSLGDEGWVSGDTRNNGSLSFVAAPGGVGALRLTTPASTDKATLQKSGFFGTIGTFEASYNWYRNAGSGGVAAPAIKLGIDTTDANVSANPFETSFDKILVYEPYYNHATLDNTWTHEAITLTSGKWWLVDIGGAGGMQGVSKTLADWLADPTYGARLSTAQIVSLQVGIGSGNAGLDAYVDDLTYTAKPWLGGPVRTTLVNFDA